MHLYLLRHCDAAEHGFTDGDRPLSILGEEQAAIVGGVFVALRLPLTMILSSPLLRAVQTAEIIRQRIGNVKYSATEYLSPGANEKQLLAQVTTLNNESLLLVGHEPQLRSVASILLAGSPHLHIEFRKASMMTLECSRGVGPGLASLKWMLTVEQMKMFVARAPR